MSGKKLIVFGGNGFVGSEVCRVALRQSWNVIVACRSGEPVGYQRREEWATRVSFVKIDALVREQVSDFLNDHQDAHAVINCIGLLTLDKRLGRRVNGDPCINIAAAIVDRPQISKFVFVSAAAMAPVDSLLLSGYYYGKRAGEKAITENLGARGAILRPGFVYGPRALHNGGSVPLQLIGRPLEMVMKPIHAFLPFGLLTPPVSVTAVARAAVFCAEVAENRGIYEVSGINELSAKL
jgi:nucleoside-diphosphate-sugar epimerase